MKSVFNKIIAHKRQELSSMRKPTVFHDALKYLKQGDIAVIAEIKLQSPSAGKLGSTEDAITKAKEYEQAGADAISVVVDQKYFGGSLELFCQIRSSVSLPLLMKDFVIDSRQIFDAVKVNADALLLIAKVHKYYNQQFLDVLSYSPVESVVEIANEDELSLSLVQNANIIGVNARDLDTFEVDIEKACAIIQKIPKNKLIIGFSGVHSRTEVEQYKNAGAQAVLVGTSLMKKQNIQKVVRDLKGLL